MMKALDLAAGSHTTLKVTERAQSRGKIVFTKENGVTHMTIINAHIGYSPGTQEGFYDMIQVLQEEGKLGDAGTIEIDKLENM